MAIPTHSQRRPASLGRKARQTHRAGEAGLRGAGARSLPLGDGRGELQGTGGWFDTLLIPRPTHGAVRRAAECVQACLSRGCRGCPAAARGRGNQRRPCPAELGAGGGRCGQSGPCLCPPLRFLGWLWLPGSGSSRDRPLSPEHGPALPTLPAAGRVAMGPRQLPPPACRSRGSSRWALRPVRASHLDFKRRRYPGIQQPGSSEHPVDKGREDKGEGRELSLGHCSHPGKLGFVSPSPA